MSIGYVKIWTVKKYFLDGPAKKIFKKKKIY